MRIASDPAGDCHDPTAVQLYEAMSAALDSGQVQLRVVRGAGHGGPEFDTQDVVADVIAFLSRHLR